MIERFLRLEKMRPTTGLSRRCALGVAAIVGGVVTVIVRAGVGVLGLGLGWGLAFGFGSGVSIFFALGLVRRSAPIILTPDLKEMLVKG